MYWTEAQGSVVEVASMDNGSGRRVLLRANATHFPNMTSAGNNTSKEPHFYGITVDDNHVYFTDWTKG